MNFEGKYKIYADYHTHTIYSHGKGTVEENVVAAIEKGLKVIAITDHGPANLFGVGINGPETILKIKEDIEECRIQYPEIKILLGVEANIISLKGEIDIPSAILNELDIVLLGLHQLIKPVDWRWIGLFGANLYYNLTGLGSAFELNTKVLEKAIETHDINIITHPGHIFPVNTPQLADKCFEHGISLEINASHGLNIEEYKKIAGHDITFVISSDAHRPEDVGEFTEGIKLVEEIGLGLERIRNIKRS